MMYFLLLRDCVLFVMLCNAVALGLIQPLSGPVPVEPTLPVDKGKGRAEKGTEKAANVCGAVLDPSGLQDARKALEVHYI